MSFLVLAPLLGAAPAIASSCEELSAELAGIGRRGGGAFAMAAARQRAELARTEALAGRCGLIASPACADLSQRIYAMRSNLARLEVASRRAGAGEGGRARLLTALRRQGCARSSIAMPSPAPGNGGLLAFLGLVPSAPAPQIIQRAAPPPPVYREGPAERALRQRIEAPEEIEDTPHGFGRGPYRTLCVRSCDGYYWPVSYSASRAAFERDEAVCRAACPNLEVSLYVHRTGTASTQAISLFGQPYVELPTANRFRERFDAACQCRPAPPEPSPDSMRAGFSPVPPQPAALPSRSAVVPLAINTGRDLTSDRETGSEGLRGVHPGRAGPLTPDDRAAGPPPGLGRSAAEGP